MKTLIINGSTKKDGDTVSLINELVNKLTGEVKILSHFDNIEPCNDCRYCWEFSGCKINDRMQEIYPYLYECDNVVIASPIWFSSLSGPVLNISSRIQILFAASYFRDETLNIKEKKGAIIIVGAEKGTEITPTKNALTIMKFMNVNRKFIKTVYSLDTNNLPANKDNNAIKEVYNVVNWLNC